MKTYRLDLTIAEYDLLKRCIDFDKMKNEIKSMQQYPNGTVYDNILDKIEKPKEIEFSVKKSLAAERATETRTKKAKEKIDNAINILRMENKKITHYSISKVAKVSFNTVRKYLTNEDLISLNQNQ